MKRRRHEAKKILQAQGIHLWFFVHIVFTGISQTIIEAARLLCESPDQALPCGYSRRFALEYGIAKSVCHADPFPAVLPQRGNYVAEIH